MRCCSVFLFAVLSSAALGQAPTDEQIRSTLCEILKSSQPQKVEFDPGKTKISFGWDGLFNAISFSFHLKDGIVRLDPAVGAASGEIVVDARSGKGGNAFRNHHFHERILESKRYPDVRFRPTTISKIVSLNRCACRFDLGGMLELRGKKAPFEFRVDIGAIGNDIDLTAVSGIVNWSTFGASDYGALFFAVEDSDVYVRAGVRVSGLQLPTGCNNPTGIAGERKPY